MRTAVLVLMLVGSLSAQSTAPLALREGKTVAIVNESDHAEVTDKAYKQLSKWGRYTIVQKDADLTFVFSTKVYEAGRSVVGNATSFGKVVSANATETINRTGQTHLTVLDRKGEVVFRNVKTWDQGGTVTLLKDLKKRVK